ASVLLVVTGQNEPRSRFLRVVHGRIVDGVVKRLHEVEDVRLGQLVDLAQRHEADRERDQHLARVFALNALDERRRKALTSGYVLVADAVRGGVELLRHYGTSSAALMAA